MLLSDWHTDVHSLAWCLSPTADILGPNHTCPLWQTWSTASPALRHREASVLLASLLLDVCAPLPGQPWWMEAKCQLHVASWAHPNLTPCWWVLASSICLTDSGQTAHLLYLIDDHPTKVFINKTCFCRSSVITMHCPLNWDSSMVVFTRARLCECLYVHAYDCACINIFRLSEF